MKIQTREVTTTVVEDFAFDVNDVVLDGNWFSVGIRRDYGGDACWHFTPCIPGSAATARTMTDAQVKDGVKSRSLMYIGNYSDLWEEAGKKNRALGIYDMES